MKRSLTLLLLLVASLAAAGVAEAQDSDGPGARTFSIFLFPDYTWLAGEKLETVQALHEQFGSFAAAVSKRNTAIWLEGKQSVADAPKAMEYCTRFGLNVTEGPYVVFTQVHPDYWRKPVHTKYYISLRGLDRAGALTMLTRLTQELVKRQPDLRGLLLTELRERLRTAITGAGLLEKIIGETSPDTMILARTERRGPIVRVSRARDLFQRLDDRSELDFQ